MATSANEEFVPVPDGTEIRIQSVLTKKSIDFDFSNGKGSRKLHQWDTLEIPNQTWTLAKSVDHAGSLIRHAETGLSLIPTTVGGDGRVYLDVGPFGHGFTFKKARNGEDNILVYLAGKEYTITVENASDENGAKLVLWPHATGAASKWALKALNEAN
ncbi:hypothetical protein BC629DRAFT_1592665 [Irpex lacteus]|nr:hypothetical protein BC629DRAFT_1592665 [Irpex lacteus]